MSEPARRTPPRMLEVESTREVTPRVRRITFKGELAGFQAWPGAHIKLFFPRGSQIEPKLPSLDARGAPVWPAAPERPVTRTYSVRYHDPEMNRLVVDFVLHVPGGPASAWAERATPGMRIGVAGPGGPRPLLGPADWYLLMADLSALPALSALLEALPREARGAAFIRVPDVGERQILSAPAGFEVNWLIDAPPNGRNLDLVARVRAFEFLRGRPFAWLAGENSEVIGARDFLRDERNLSRAQLYAIPYWKRDESEEQYHAERHRVMDELEAGAS